MERICWIKTCTLIKTHELITRRKIVLCWCLQMSVAHLRCLMSSLVAWEKACTRGRAHNSGVLDATMGVPLHLAYFNAHGAIMLEAVRGYGGRQICWGTTLTGISGLRDGRMPCLHRVPRCRLHSSSSHTGYSALVHRRFATQTTHQPSKPTGDISSVFPSLSGVSAPPLPPRFAALKTRLVAGHEDALQAGWQELLHILKRETEEIEALGSAVIPEIEYRDIGDIEKRTTFRDGLRKRGVAVIRGVVSEKEALDWKELLKRYIKTNSDVRGRHMVVARLRLRLLGPTSRALSLPSFMAAVPSILTLHFVALSKSCKSYAVEIF